MKSLKTYIVLENHLQVKRKYSKHDPIHVGANAPVRNTILGFIAEKGSCSEGDLKEFIKTTNEATGKSTGTSWLSKNSRYLTVVEKEGVKSYKLSKLGQRVVKASTVNEAQVKIEEVPGIGKSYVRSYILDIISNSVADGLVKTLSKNIKSEEYANLYAFDGNTYQLGNTVTVKLKNAFDNTVDEFDITVKKKKK